MLNYEVLKNRLLKKEDAPLMIYGHFKSYKPHSGLIFTPTWSAQCPRYVSQPDRITHPLDWRSIPSVFAPPSDCPRLPAH